MLDEVVCPLATDHSVCSTTFTITQIYCNSIFMVGNRVPLSSVTRRSLPTANKLQVCVRDLTEPRSQSCETSKYNHLVVRKMPLAPSSLCPPTVIYPDTWVSSSRRQPRTTQRSGSSIQLQSDSWAGEDCWREITPTSGEGSDSLFREWFATHWNSATQ